MVLVSAVPAQDISFRSFYHIEQHVIANYHYGAHTNLDLFLAVIIMSDCYDDLSILLAR